MDWNVTVHPETTRGTCCGPPTSTVAAHSCPTSRKARCRLPSVAIPKASCLPSRDRRGEHRAWRQLNGSTGHSIGARNRKQTAANAGTAGPGTKTRDPLLDGGLPSGRGASVAAPQRRRLPRTPHHGRPGCQIEGRRKCASVSVKMMTRREITRIATAIDDRLSFARVGRLHDESALSHDRASPGQL